MAIREIKSENVQQLHEQELKTFLERTPKSKALYERAVGFYAGLINVNAYHQPGVEAGKKAAQDVIALQGKVLEALRAQPGAALTADEIAHYLGAPGKAEDIYHLLRHLAVTDRVTRQSATGPEAAYQIK